MSSTSLAAETTENIRHVYGCFPPTTRDAIGEFVWLNFVQVFGLPFPIRRSTMCQTYRSLYVSR